MNVMNGPGNPLLGEGGWPGRECGGREWGGLFVYTGDFCRGNSLQFLSHQVSNMFKPLRYHSDKSH